MKTKQFRYSKDNFQISKAPTFVKDSSKDLKKIKKHIKKNVKRLAKAQAKLYARHEYSILIVLQGMDAAGKDSMIRHVLTGINPSGFNVASFKQPTAEELDHDYLWRVTRKLPPRGHIGVFNRSYYEDVLVSRVHPQIILNDNLPEVHSLADVNDKFFEKRYKDIRHYEEHLAKNGYIILKFSFTFQKMSKRSVFWRELIRQERTGSFLVLTLRNANTGTSIKMFIKKQLMLLRLRRILGMSFLLMINGTHA